MIGLLFASLEEAEPFLARYERGRFDDLSEGEILEDGQLAVSIIGAGKVKATLRTERFLASTRVALLIEAGLCTALKSDVKANTVVTASQVMEGDRIALAAPTYPRMPLQVLDDALPQGTLVTQDHFVQSDEERTYWQRIADFVDSTGYAVSYVAATHGVSGSIIKAVGGHLGEDSANVREARARAADALAGYLLTLIQRLRDDS